MTDREKHIKVLENLLSHYKTREKCEGYYDNTLKDNVEALEYAISSLKTDESYQIMYEGGEVFTKDDMAAMLEDLKQDIIAESWHIECYDVNANDLVVQISDVDKVIQQKLIL